MFPFVDGVTINFAEIDAKVKAEQQAEDALFDEYLALDGRPKLRQLLFDTSASAEGKWCDVADLDDWYMWRKSRV